VVELPLPRGIAIRLAGENEEPLGSDNERLGVLRSSGKTRAMPRT